MPSFYQTQEQLAQKTVSVLSLEEFRTLLEAQSGKQVSLSLKQNRSTMLSVRWDSRNCNQANVSMHPMFLRAPRNVMDALACYIREETQGFAPEIKQFISLESHSMLPHEQAKVSTVYPQGNHFDLNALYHEVNKTYFDDALQLAITWFGAHEAKNRSKISLGLFSAPSQLIKIHRILDQKTTPHYVLAFIIYHEMLHSVVKPCASEKGSTRIHHTEFKKREQQFANYAQATGWIAKHRACFFV